MKIRTQSFYCMVGTIIMVICLSAVTGKCQTPEAVDVTPSDVFGVMDLASRSLDVILMARGITDRQETDLSETGLRPMHVYQMTVACIDTIIRFQIKEGISSAPQVVTAPRSYTPGEVKILADMLLTQIRKIGDELDITGLPEDKHEFYHKIPTDVFMKAVSIFHKMSALNGLDNITPNQVFPQMVRAVSDVKSLLAHIDPAQRFRIDAPDDAHFEEITPNHVFKECLTVREDINKLRKHLRLREIPVPDFQEDRKLHPADVFIQTQIIIAELNLIKMTTGTISATPLPIPVSGKTSRDVDTELMMARYLLTQVIPLQEMVKAFEELRHE